MVGNIQNKKQQPNSVQAQGLIFHVGISIVDRGSSGEPELLEGTRAPVLKKRFMALSFPSPYAHPTQGTGEINL